MPPLTYRFIPSLTDFSAFIDRRLAREVENASSRRVAAPGQGRVNLSDSLDPRLYIGSIAVRIPSS